MGEESAISVETVDAQSEQTADTGRTEPGTAPTRAWTQDEIDEEMLADEDRAGDDELEADINCGKYPGSNGCSLAGTEWCDWSCPYSRPAARSRVLP